VHCIADVVGGDDGGVPQVGIWSVEVGGASVLEVEYWVATTSSTWTDTGPAGASGQALDAVIVREVYAATQPSPPHVPGGYF